MDRRAHANRISGAVSLLSTARRAGAQVGTPARLRGECSEVLEANNTQSHQGQEGQERNQGQNSPNDRDLITAQGSLLSLETTQKIFYPNTSANEKGRSPVGPRLSLPPPGEKLTSNKTDSKDNR